MDLKSGSFDDGMAAFEKRAANSYISRLAKALISADKGDNQDSALNYLMSDMNTLAKEMMQRELAKRPGRVLVADPASYKRSQTVWDMSIILNEARDTASAGGPFWAVW